MDVIKEKKYGVKVLEKAAKALISLSHYSDDATALYANVYSDDSKETYIFSCTACHAGMTRAYADAPKTPNIFVTSTIPKGFSAKGCTAPARRKLAIKFWDWLLNDSIWSGVFIERDVKKVMKAKGFLCRTDVPDNLLFSAVCATRAVWEYTSQLFIWEKLVDKGVHPSFAFIVCKSVKFCERYNSKGKFQENSRNKITFEPHYLLRGLENTCHWPLPFAYFSKLQIPDFVNKVFLKYYKNRKTYKVSGTYSWPNDAWKGFEKDNLYHVIAKAIDKISKEKRKGFYEYDKKYDYTKRYRVVVDEDTLVKVMLTAYSEIMKQEN